MTSTQLYLFTGIALFALGLFSLLYYRHLLRQIIAINIMGAGVFMTLIATAYREEGAADPVPQAMVLTGIVVAVCATSLALVLAWRLRAATNRAALPASEDSEEP